MWFDIIKEMSINDHILSLKERIIAQLKREGKESENINEEVMDVIRTHIITNPQKLRGE